MGKKSKIEWTDATWNPWMGCTKVSQGCKHCYMFREQKRYGHDPSTLRRSKTTFNDPLKWDEPRKIFVCSWSDFWHEDVPNMWRLEALNVMRVTDHHDYLIPTKRPENILSQVSKLQLKEIDGCTWLGISAENQEVYDKRVKYLKDLPSKVKFISAEPMLEPIDFNFNKNSFIDWVIIGGESGNGARPFNLWWAEYVVGQCRGADTPVFVKQMGENPLGHDGTSLNYSGKGNDMDEWPKYLRIRELPENK